MIRLTDVHKRFGAKVVLRGLTLDVPEGMNTVVIGASGSGKSVTLKLIVGLLEPDAGRVEVDGHDLGELDREGLTALRGSIGYVFQFAALFDSMTVADNIRLGLVKRGLGDDEIRARIAESLALVELPGQEDRYPAELSGGMRKRVGIARALVTDPEIVFFDEPTTGLDPILVNTMHHLIRELHQKSRFTAVIVSHEIPEIFAVADRIAVLHDGVIVETGPSQAIQGSANPMVQHFIRGEVEMTEKKP